MKKKGFTLIELMVVISALSLFIAMLMPAFSHLREKIKEGKILKQIEQEGLIAELKDFKVIISPNKSYKQLG